MNLLSIFLLALLHVLESTTHETKKLFLSLHWWTSLTLFIYSPYVDGFMSNFWRWLYFMNTWMSFIRFQRIIPLNRISLWKIMLLNLGCRICYHRNIDWILGINNLLFILSSCILFARGKYYLRHSILINVEFQIRDWLSLFFLWNRLFNRLFLDSLLMLFLNFVWIDFNAWSFTWFSW